MVVFISDLHISDKTTGVQHLEIDAFEEALGNIARQAKNAGSKEITFVFLGDIFDLVRTTFWVQKPLIERPWGLPVNATPAQIAAVQTNAVALIDEIIEKNDKIFKMWGKPLPRKYHLPEKQTRIYIPGNHDRICNEFPALRERVIESLGLNIGRETQLDPHVPFDYYFHSSLYKVFARHGQEWDNYNFERVADWSQSGYIIPPPEHYLEIPIGEVIAAEVASLLPTAVCQNLKGKIDDDDLKIIIEHMKTIDDVRPMAAILPWLIDSLLTQTAMRQHRSIVVDALANAVRTVISAFDTLPFTQAWMEKHDSFAPLDYVDRLQLAILALKNLDITRVNRILQMAESRPAHAVEAILRIMPCIDDALRNDNYATMASKDLKRIESDPQFAKTLYMLYGHTHRAEQVPIDTPKDSSCQVYLNTGTWRPLYRQAVSQIGFMRWKNLTFTIFYNAEDDPKIKFQRPDPTFETWTGSLLDPLNHNPNDLTLPC